MKKQALVSLLCIGAIAAGGSAMAADKVDIGKLEYESACAVCHGIAGKGDGPLRSQLVSPVPDITVLAERNGGVFPFDRVYQVIDGRLQVKAHGTREMPVWGARFSLESSVYFENYPSRDLQSSVRSRILALVEYVYRLQKR